MRSFLLYLGYAAAAVPATFVKNREAFCLAAELPTSSRAIGTSRRELSWDRPSSVAFDLLGHL